MQEVDLLREICGAQGGYEAAEVRHVERTCGGREVRGRAGNKVDGVFSGRPQSFRYQRRSVDNCRPGRGVMAQDGRTSDGTFYGKMDRCRESQGWTMACSSMPNVTGGTKAGIAQSKCAPACSFAIVD